MPLKRKKYSKRRTPKRTPKRRTPKRTPKRRTPKRTPKRRTPKRTPKPCRDDQKRNSKTGRCNKIIPVGQIGIPAKLRHVVLGCTELNKWTIEKTNKLGTGAVGAVYLTCKNYSCNYAAKMQSITGGLFFREVEVIEQLKGLSYVPAVYATFICGNMGYIIMEKLVPLTPQSVKLTWLEVSNNITAFLTEMYESYKVVFVDIHPGNVMVRDGQLVLIDFGWAIKFNKPEDLVSEDHPIIKLNPHYKNKKITIYDLKQIQDRNIIIFRNNIESMWENPTE